MRVFVAIEIPQGLRKKIFQAAEGLKGRVPAKLVEEENLHLTLLFFRDLSEKEVSDLITAVEKAARRVKPIALRLTNAEVFPAWRPRGAWVRVIGETEMLRKLHAGIIGEIGEIGEISRRFSPHITFCRFKKGFVLNEAAGKLIEKISFNDEFRVEEVVVFQSHLSSKGPTYTKIAEVKLTT